MPALLLNTISLANTFSEWVTVTNDLVDGFNGFEFVDFEKPSGTLYLNDPTLGLSVSNNSIFHGTLEVAGTGSNLLVRKNAEIQGRLGLVFFGRPVGAERQRGATGEEEVPAHAQQE